MAESTELLGRWLPTMETRPYSVSRFGVGAILYGCPINKRGMVGKPANRDRFINENLGAYLPAPYKTGLLKKSSH